jgi:hypothetical protein
MFAVLSNFVSLAAEAPAAPALPFWATPWEKVHCKTPGCPEIMENNP